MTGREDFETFFRRDFPRLVLFLVKKGATQSDAEDAAQDAMLRAALAWADIASPAAWVRITAQRSWWKRLRPEVPMHDTDIPLPAGEDPTAIEEEKWRTVQLLRSLPPAQRAVVALYYDGFSTREISAVVGTSEATVRSSLRHGRARLREMLGSGP
ncbi:RNA polymerase sigma factor [Frankia sp. QA3]|uniref:RNA polymerase sigma factor n=1 Tax=Frankia sp. QA3 TaxID=710111 RepID=UPI000269C0E8|nr:RNA polymerase sigma factor [Frankia sp. QA3]EIV92045.1 RNA polymerase sigma factor, sigma-70 family [Frankia sp. QA3]